VSGEPRAKAAQKRRPPKKRQATQTR